MSVPASKKWASGENDVTGLNNIASEATAKSDMNGKTNTAVIVSYHTSIGETSDTSAAIYCNTYTGEIDGTLGKWYLPSTGELYLYTVGNYSTINPVANMLNWTYWNGGAFWSSFEESSRYAWFVTPGSGYTDYMKKTNYWSVSCFLDIS